MIYKVLNLTITTDNNIFDKEYNLTPEIKKQLSKTQKLAVKGEKKVLPLLLDLIKRYPDVPIFRNYLTNYYKTIGESEKAFEITRELYADFPNYFYAVVNLANEYLDKSKPEKALELLGEDFDLQKIYPNRKIFHLDELLAILSLQVKYYCAINLLDKADKIAEIIEEIDLFENKYSFVKEMIEQKKIQNLTKVFFNTKSMQNDRLISEMHKMKQVNKTPVFTHTEIEKLYQHSFKIVETSYLEGIIKLPRESVIKDLELVLLDSMQRMDFYIKKEQEESYLEENFSFVIHALFLLAELESEESLPIILDVLSQNEDYLDLFIGDVLTDGIWQVIYKTGKNQLETLKDFMLKPDVYNFCKIEVAESVSQFFYRYPLRKKEISDWFRFVLNFYLDSAKNGNIDYTLNAFVVGFTANMKFKEFLPLIKEMYDCKFVDVTVDGTYKDVENIMNENSDFKREDKSILEYYKTFIPKDLDENSFDSSSFFDKEEDTYFPYEDIFPIRKEKKIGRNEPCPCGSGKKYKKCCINK